MKFLLLTPGTGHFFCGSCLRDDQLGRIFNHDMRALGVDIRLPRADGGAPTARSHVLITEDGQRTMQTYLGACLELGLADITSETVGVPRVMACSL